MKRKSLTLAFVAILALACGAAFAGYPVTNYLPPDVMAGLAAAGAIPFAMSGEIDLKEVKTIIEDQGKAWKEYRETNDALIKAKADGKSVEALEAKLVKIEKDMQAGEEVNKKLTAVELEAKAVKVKAEENEKALGELEAKFNRIKLGNGGQEKKNWNDWAMAVIGAGTKGEVNLTADERKLLEDVRTEYKAMSVGNDTTGGYLAPVEYVREIIKGVTDISPVRQLARVRTTAAKSIQLPKRTGQFAAVWVAEQGTKAETDGLRYGMLEIPTHEMYALVDISNQNLEDSAFNMADEIEMEATEQFAVAEGAAFVTGTGVGKPEGFITNASVGVTNSGSAAAITADGMLTLKHALKTAYARNANWAMNRTTLGSVRKLKDLNNNYLWVPGIANGAPNTIDGDPYVEVPDMASEAGNAKPLAYGDFRRAYTLVDRIVMELLRDPYTQATSGNVRFIFRRRMGGMVTLPEAIRIQKCAA